MSYTGSTVEEIIKQIGDEAYNGWKGKTGEERRESVLAVLSRILIDFHELTGLPRLSILLALEKARNINCVNWYQECKFPPLNEIHVFPTISDFKNRFPSGKYECPKCGGASTNAYECNVGKCDWKVYGLFGHMGKGIEVIIVDQFLNYPKPTSIFKPI